MASGWCMFELQMAAYKILDEKKNKLIFLLIEPIPEKEQPKTLRVFLKIRTYIPWVYEQEGQRLFWARLIRAVSKPTDSENTSLSTMGPSSNDASTKTIMSSVSYEAHHPKDVIINYPLLNKLNLTKYNENLLSNNKRLSKNYIPSIHTSNLLPGIIDRKNIRDNNLMGGFCPEPRYDGFRILSYDNSSFCPDQDIYNTKVHFPQNPDYMEYYVKVRSETSESSYL